MPDRRDFATLADRVKALVLNTAVYYAAFVAASGLWLPTGGLESVWLLSGVSLWLLSLLSAPWFVPPRDALANGIAALCILVTTDLTGVSKFAFELNAMRWIFVGYSAFVVTLAIVALFIHDKNQLSAVGRLTFRVTSALGRGELFYTPPAIISILGAYQVSATSTGWLLILWVTFVVGRPIERFLTFHRQWLAENRTSDDSPTIGTIERIDAPNIVRVRLHKRTTWKPGSLHIAALSDGNQQFVLGLFDQVQGAEVMGTGLCVAQVAIEECLDAVAGQVYVAHDEARAAQFIDNLSGTPDAKLVGFTVENSTIGTLRFEVAVVSELAEGDVVFTKVAGREVFYQILDAETAEENFDQNPRGTHIVKAVQLGCYDPEAGFTKHPWLPAMNSPLFWAKSRQFPEAILEADEFVIGQVPSTNIGVVAKIPELVEYHTAILGVTGTGKTELALDIVREAQGRGVKVFCVDFTGEYRQRLADLNPIFPAP
ncbi:MAG: helicase HerA domain-containing protein, partial [Pseudolabrys sp.]